MTETRTCARCGRTGTRQFYRVSNPHTGIPEWLCASQSSCRERMRNEPLPCDHDKDQIGRVQAGELKLGRPHCSVYTCRACAPASQQYVTRHTGGLPASDLIPFDRDNQGDNR